MGGCGTARPNSAGFPPQVKIPKQKVERHEYHSLKAMVLTGSLFPDKVGVHAWIDNTPVNSSRPCKQARFRSCEDPKRPGTKSTNAKRAREAFGDAEMPIPLYTDDCNQHIGGVDQLRS